MLTGWFKCPVQAWQHVRWLIPKPWPPGCMTADVRWWNDQLKMGWQAARPDWAEPAALWGVTEDEAGQVCVEVTEGGERKATRRGTSPPRARASRGLSDQTPDQTPDQTTYLKSVSERSGSGAREDGQALAEEDLERHAALMKEKCLQDF